MQKVKRIRETTFQGMISRCFKLYMHRQKDELSAITDKLKPLQLSYQAKNNQVTYYIDKCTSFEDLNKQLQSQLHSLKSQMTIKESGTSDLKDTREARLSDADALNEKLAAKLQRTQEEQLRKLEEYKTKYQEMQRELNVKGEIIE